MAAVRNYVVQYVTFLCIIEVAGQSDRHDYNVISGTGTGSNMKGSSVNCEDPAMSHIPHEEALDSTARLQILRQLMLQEGYDALYATNNNQFNNPQLDIEQRRIFFLSGYSSVTAMAVVFQSIAAIWVPPASFYRAQTSVNCNWIIFPTTSDKFHSASMEWVLSYLRRRKESQVSLYGETNRPQIIGAESATILHIEWEKWDAMIEDATTSDFIVQLKAVDISLIDIVWNQMLPHHGYFDVSIFPLDFTSTEDETFKDNVDELLEILAEQEVDLLVVTDLKEIAWMTNLRGKEYPFVFTFPSILLIDAITGIDDDSKNNENYYNHFEDTVEALLFVPLEDLHINCSIYFNSPIFKNCPGSGCLRILDIDSFRLIISGIHTNTYSHVKKWKRIWMSEDVNQLVYDLIVGGSLEKDIKVIIDDTPIYEWVLQANKKQMEGMKTANRLESQFSSMIIAEFLDEFYHGKNWTDFKWGKEADKARLKFPHAWDLGFYTLFSSGVDSGDFSYHPSGNKQRFIERDMLIFSTGGHYRMGSTDIARTIHLGTPTDLQKIAYTRVLQGIIEIMNVKFPINTTETDLNVLVRRWLYQSGMDFSHSAGHGVDPLISCWRFPPEVRQRNPENFLYSDDLAEGMILAIEPAFYLPNSFGIRLGVIMRVISYHHLSEDSLDTFRNVPFLHLDVLSFVPFDNRLIIFELLTESQKLTLNEYNIRVRRFARDNLKLMNKDVAVEWINNMTDCQEYGNSKHFIRQDYSVLIGSHSSGIFKKSSVDCEHSEMSHVPLKHGIDTSVQLELLRQLMRQEKIDAYIIPMNDEFNSGNIRERANRIRFMSGYTGDEALAVVMHSVAAIWIKPFDFASAQSLVSCNWIIFATSEPFNNIVMKWVTSFLRRLKISDVALFGRSDRSQIIGADPALFSHKQWIKWENEIPKRSENLIIGLTAVKRNLVDIVWSEVLHPDQLFFDSYIFPLNYEDAQEGSFKLKMKYIIDILTEHGVELLVLTDLNEIAWLTNLRGNEYSYVFTFPSVLLIDTLLGLSGETNYSSNLADNVEAILFAPLEDFHVNSSIYFKSSKYKVCPGITCLRIMDISSFSLIVYVMHLSNYIHKRKWKKIWLSPNVNELVYSLIVQKSTEANVFVLIEESPISQWLLKSSKQQMEAMRSANLHESRFLSIVISKILLSFHDNHNWTEYEMAQWIDQQRMLFPKSWAVGIKTVVASGPNSGLYYYSPTIWNSRLIQKNDIIIIGTGGHFKDGSTDVTRTIHLGTATEFQKIAYTRVLQGLVEVFTAKFPVNTTVKDLDVFVRKWLYRNGLDFPHVSGHGIEPLISCVKFPPEIRQTTSTNFKAVQLAEGMILAIEPGYYKENIFGVRLGMVVRVTSYHHNIVHQKLLNIQRNVHFLGLDTLTFVPFDNKLIKWDFLTDDQKKWLRTYSIRVKRFSRDSLKSMKEHEAANWINEVTEPFDKLTPRCIAVKRVLFHSLLYFAIFTSTVNKFIMV